MPFLSFSVFLHSLFVLGIWAANSLSPADNAADDGLLWSSISSEACFAVSSVAAIMASVICRRYRLLLWCLLCSVPKGTITIISPSERWSPLDLCFSALKKERKQCREKPLLLCTFLSIFICCIICLDTWHCCFILQVKKCWWRIFSISLPLFHLFYCLDNTHTLFLII